MDVFRTFVRLIKPYMKKIILLFAVLFVAACSSSNKDYQKAASNPEFLIRAEVMLTESIIHDIFAPPVSSRIYMYASIAGYEAAIHGEKGYKSLVGQLNGFEQVAQPEKGKEYCYPLASTRAFLSVGKKGKENLGSSEMNSGSENPAK